MRRNSELLSQRILLSECARRAVADADADARARSHQPGSRLRLYIRCVESWNPAKFNHWHRHQCLPDSGSTRLARGLPDRQSLQLSELGQHECDPVRAELFRNNRVKRCRGSKARLSDRAVQPLLQFEIQSRPYRRSRLQRNRRPRPAYWFRQWYAGRYLLPPEPAAHTPGRVLH